MQTTMQEGHVLASSEKERFFQALETDQVLFKETCELVFNLTVSDPELTEQVARLIETDFRNLYLTIMKNVLGDIATSSKIECYEKTNKEDCEIEKLLGKTK